MFLKYCKQTDEEDQYMLLNLNEHNVQKPKAANKLKTIMQNMLARSVGAGPSIFIQLIWLTLFSIIIASQPLPMPLFLLLPVSTAILPLFQWLLLA